MNYNDDELDLILKDQELRKAFVEAKEHKAEDPKAYAEAKAAYGEHRRFWRTIRQSGGGVPEQPAPAVIEATTTN